jgi:hypothetical protein
MTSRRCSNSARAAGSVIDSAKFVDVIPGRDDRHPKVVACFLPKTLRYCADRHLGARVDRLTRRDPEGRGGGRVDEMPKALATEHRKRRRDPEQDTFEVDVDHRFPVVDAVLVKR